MDSFNILHVYIIYTYAHMHAYIMGDGICGALVQFGCYHHSIKGNPVIKL